LDCFHIQFLKKSMSVEINTSTNTRPNGWFNTIVNYSILGGCNNSFGTVLGIRTGFVHRLVATDFIAFQKMPLSLKKLNANKPDLYLVIPYNTKKYNLSLGMNLVLDELKPNIGLHKRFRKKACRCN